MPKIPNETKQWKQNNRSNLLGNIWSSFNLDFQGNLGRLRVSPRLLATTTTATNASLTTAPCAFAYYDGSLWTISGTKVHSAETTNGLIRAFSVDASAGTPTDCDVAYSDMVTFNSRLYVSGKSNQLYGFNGTNWTSNSSPYTIGASDIGPHPMTVYGNLLYYLRSDNIVYSFTTGFASSLLLTYGDGNQRILWMRAARDRVWIGTLNKQGGKGQVLEWDGASSQVTRVYRLEAQGALACVIKDDTPWIMDSNGRLCVFSGGNFKEVDRLPINRGFLVNATSNINNRFIHPNGMSIINSRINMLVANQNSDNGATINENLPSGVWEYDEGIGLYHKHAISYHAASSGSVTDYGQNRLVTSASAADVALIPAGALSDIRFYTNTSTTNGTFLAGCMYNTTATATSAGVFTDDINNTLQKAGYLVTTWIDSAQVMDFWQKIFIKHRKLLNSNNEIVLKYRQTEVASTEITFTWSSTTELYSATDLSGYVGYEVEIIQGQGGGRCAHITAVTTVGSNYLATLDETFSNITNSNTGKARLQDWKKIGSITNQTEEVDQFAIGVSSPRVQLKCCLIFQGNDEIHELNLINQVKEPAQ